MRPCRPGPSALVLRVGRGQAWTLVGIGASIDARSFIDFQGTVMKFLPKIVLVLTAAASCAAGAASALTPEQDQARRDRNREEALAAYHASAQSRGDSATYSSSGSAKMNTAPRTPTTAGRRRPSTPKTRSRPTPQGRAYRRHQDRQGDQAGARFHPSPAEQGARLLGAPGRSLRQDRLEPERRRGQVIAVRRCLRLDLALRSARARS